MQTTTTGHIAQVRAMLAHHARLARAYADRAEEARAAGEYDEMARWAIAYRRATARCRALGEVIRASRSPMARISVRRPRRVPTTPRGRTCHSINEVSDEDEH